MQLVAVGFAETGRSIVRFIPSADQRHNNFGHNGANGHENLSPRQVHEGLKWTRAKIAKLRLELKPLYKEIGRILEGRRRRSKIYIGGRLASAPSTEAELRVLEKSARSLGEQLYTLEQAEKALARHPNNKEKSVRVLKGPKGAAERKELRKNRRPRAQRKKNWCQQGRRIEVQQQTMLLTYVPNDEEVGENLVAAVNIGQIAASQVIKRLRAFRRPKPLTL